MAKIPTLEEMLKAGVHFGHQSSRWHPKMGEFIHSKRNGVHIIDLEKTQTQLEAAMTFVTGVVSRGGTVLFLGTKAQTRDYVEAAAKRAGMPFVTDRWLGGTITNFGEIHKLIKRLLDLKRRNETGDLKKYTKKEQLMFSREIEELEGKVGGISTMSRLPEAVVVFDVRNELTAVKEAARSGVKVVALCDTNINPRPVDYVIPANDDAVGSISMMTELMADAVLEGKKTAPKSATKKEAPKKVAIK
jgi:small subunit ribosomal protein S2